MRLFIIAGLFKWRCRASLLCASDYSPLHQKDGVEFDRSAKAMPPGLRPTGSDAFMPMKTRSQRREAYQAAVQVLVHCYSR
jgi:hypothetical protein